MKLHEALAARRDEVIQRWKSQVQGTLAPESISHLELVDHLPTFVNAIIGALRADEGLATPGRTPDETIVAADHGEQRLRLGFSLEAVVLEYGALRAAILATAQAAGVDPTLRELQIVFDAVIQGIAHAVAEYARQRDAELMRQANEHFAFVAHELRNPLGTARAAFQIVQERWKLPPDNRGVQVLDHALSQLSTLIDETLHVARIASGIDLRPEWTSLGALLEECRLGALPEAEAKEVALEVSVAQDERIHVDVRLIRSALGNLLRNAVKYTSRGGSVELRGHVAGRYAVMEVEDCCGGLPPGKVEEAFAPFVRLDTAQSGFGLGLAIARQAAVAHGGGIRVQNLPGKGCIFVLELPLPADG